MTLKRLIELLELAREKKGEDIEVVLQYDDETKDLIIRAFMQGLFQQPGIVEELKSSSLIESDYFEDANENDYNV